MSSETRSESIEKIAELLKEIRVAMLVTQDEQGRVRSRPMWTQDAPFDGTVWFLTPADSSAAADITHVPRVNLAYANASAESYLSAAGDAQILNDREKIREFWSPMLKAWWDGPDDPAIRVIRVDVEEVEYWDTPGGKLVSLFQLAKGMVTGKQSQQSDNETVHF
jgi:general stress protein 26